MTYKKYRKLMMAFMAQLIADAKTPIDKRAVTIAAKMARPDFKNNPFKSYSEIWNNFAKCELGFQVFDKCHK